MTKWDDLTREMYKAIWNDTRGQCDSKFDKVKAEGDRLQEKAEKWDEIEPYLPKLTAHLLIEYLKKSAESSVFMNDQSSEVKPQ